MAVDGSDSFHLVAPKHRLNCQKDMSNFRTYHLGFVFLLVILIFLRGNSPFFTIFWENMFGSLFPNHLKSNLSHFQEFRSPSRFPGHNLRFVWNTSKNIRRKPEVQFDVSTCSFSGNPKDTTWHIDPVIALFPNVRSFELIVGFYMWAQKFNF